MLFSENLSLLALRGPHTLSARLHPPSYTSFALGVLYTILAHSSCVCVLPVAVSSCLRSVIVRSLVLLGGEC
ncbi:hypothetical protein BD309DRAFT_953442 [Dichomitus squalens]|uniref:Uncharacterized protein n=1 Tax=Dichomitus squalens TaxID=114155 RepID=A0A4Q9NXU6_9APHY|nr:hypothetical protein BD311DRAFT_747563 [Dichomitus squalens]TBU46699.1 hypothetical protein BD309DRAFT_953442 [Dichomitus squalens]TBU57506.1 hypothetical protein BD310DRAFT_929207 [Dichomitus squalens]